MFIRTIVRQFALFAVGLGLIGLPLAASFAQGGKLVAGTLTCKGKGNIGLILGSKESLSCVYVPAGHGRAQDYAASISKFGLDVGFTTGSIMIWTVLGAASSLPPGALSGTYAGASAEVSVGLGVGANALVGGNKNAIVLQPLSVQGQTGLNLAVGVTELKLRR